MDEQEMEKAVAELAKKAANATVPIEAMQFAQAAVNVANALETAKAARGLNH